MDKVYTLDDSIASQYRLMLTIRQVPKQPKEENKEEQEEKKNEEK